jgi:hypothetical protein
MNDRPGIAQAKRHLAGHVVHHDAKIAKFLELPDVIVAVEIIFPEGPGAAVRRQQQLCTTSARWVA